MDEAQYALLKAEVTDRYREIEQVYKRIGERSAHFGDHVESLDSMGYQLHNLYCAFEQLFETVAHFFENHVDGGRYHTDLLRRMRISIEGIRPALVSDQTFDLLDELRRFRHFFRHAYIAELRFENLQALVKKALEVKRFFENDQNAFFDQLKPME